VPEPEEAREVAARVAAAGGSMICLAVDGAMRATIVISDRPRWRARETVARLKGMGIARIVMLTGDLEATARAVAEELGIDSYMGQLLPDGKAAQLRKMAGEGRRVMMVGDGLNDSAALSLARVGVALSDASGLAKDVANVQLLNGRLDALPVARLLASRAMRRARENYWLIVSINTLFLALGLMGLMGAGITSFLHNLSTLMIARRAAKPFLKPWERLPARPETADGGPASREDAVQATGL
jgi:P-type E1-E2 ATPase